MIKLWRALDWDARIFIFGGMAVLLEFAIGFGYLYHLAVQLDAAGK